jgi:hypothetical protein
MTTAGRCEPKPGTAQRQGKPAMRQALPELRHDTAPGRAATVAGHTRRAWIDGDPAYPDVMTVGRRTFDRRTVRTRLRLLRGRDLMCPCEPGRPCHGDVLIDRANPPADESNRA